MAKVKLARVLVTSFDKLHHLCSPVCFVVHNLVSSMLKCEGSLTFSLKSMQ